MADSPCCGVPDRTLGNGELFPQTLFILASSSCFLSSRVRRSECSVCTCWIRVTSFWRRQWSLLELLYGLKDWLSGSIDAVAAFEITGLLAAEPQSASDDSSPALYLMRLVALVCACSLLRHLACRPSITGARRRCARCLRHFAVFPLDIGTSFVVALAGG